MEEGFKYKRQRENWWKSLLTTCDLNCCLIVSKSFDGILMRETSRKDSK